MKSNILIIVFTLLATSLFAQVDRSKLPEPGPARPIEIGDPVMFELKNGMKVFVVENHKLPRITFSLVLDLKPIQEGDKAGYLSMVGPMLRRGTTTRTKAQLDEEIDFIGASLGASSGSIFGSSLTKHKDKMLELMTDVLYNPVFPEEELEKIRTQTLSGLAAEKENPDAISGNISTVLTYGKEHPYGELTTEETVKNITIDDIKNYYQTYFKPNIAYLAIVGDITPKEAKKLVKTHFNDWESGAIPATNYAVPEAPEKSFVALVDRSSAVQSVIDIAYPLELKPGTPDVVKTRVMNLILGSGAAGRLFINLREDKGYTYGAYSSLSANQNVGIFSAGASVRNEVTDSAVHEFLYEMNRIRTEPVEEDELALAKSSIAGSFARSLENPQTIASFAISKARYNYPDDYYRTYLQRVQAVTKEDVMAMANKYIRPDHANITVVGKAGEIADKMSAFGDVRYFDMYGNEYVPSDVPPIPDGMTADKIITSYIEAIGGAEKLNSVKDMKVVSEASIQGQTLQITSVNQAPNKSYSSVVVGGAFEVNKSVFDGENYVQFAQGQKQPNNSTDSQDAAIKSLMFPELRYGDMGVKTKLTTVEKVGDAYAYAVEVTYPSGTKLTDYFDMETLFKVRQSTTVQTPQGEMQQTVDFENYEEVEGIKLPKTVVIPVGGGMKITAQATTVAINKGVDEGLFKIDN